MGVRKVRKGQSFRAPSVSDANAAALATDKFRRGPDRTPERQQIIDPSRIIVKNTTGQARRRGDLLVLSKTPILTAVTAENVYVNTNTYSSSRLSTSHGYWPQPYCILLEPIASTKYGRAQVAGVCPAYVYVNNVNDRWAVLDETGSTIQRLESTESPSTVQIMQMPASTGEQLCMVNLSVQEECTLIGKAVGNGVTAYNPTTGAYGTGVMAVYRRVLATGTMSALLDAAGNQVYVTVYSVSDDPILPHETHTYLGVSYTGYSVPEYHYLHRDVWGEWWVTPQPHSECNYVTGTFPDPLVGGTIASSTGGTVGYLVWVDVTGYQLNLDSGVLGALLGSAGADGFCEVKKTADYDVSFEWAGGYVYPDSALDFWARFCKVRVTPQYNAGSGWVNLIPQSTLITSEAVRVSPSYTSPGPYWTQDHTGGFQRTLIRLTKGTKLRAAITLTAFHDGTAGTLYGPIEGTFTLIRHA